MPNLFAKKAARGETIELYGGGTQLKSLVALGDVVRCIKFIEEDDTDADHGYQTYHVSNEAMEVREVAKLIKNIFPVTKITETSHEVPNEGYSISNAKLLATGFKFLYHIDGALNEMIENWSPQKIKTEEYSLLPNAPFEDERGIINNYELPEPINLIGYIESKKGTLRANHYHPIQEQKCLLISGQYISITKDILPGQNKKVFKIINPGEIAVIPPNIAHAMIFTEDSVLLNLVRGEREPENYGITHTIPYTLVRSIEKEDLLQNYKTKCRCCGGKKLKSVLNLGRSPLANNLLDFSVEPALEYPLELMYCTVCHNAQLSYVVPPEEMFSNYLYVSSTSPSFRKHFEDAAEKYINYFKLFSGAFIVDIGSNDGIALKPYLDRGYRNVLGVEPAENIAKIANDNRIPTLNAFFDSITADKILRKYGEADIVTASNVFAHTDRLKDFVHNAFYLLKYEGTLIIEVQYLIDTIKDLTFDNIYHEHVNYWSVTSLVHFIGRIGLAVIKVEHIPTHGGSIRAYIQRPIPGRVTDFSVPMYINNERPFLAYETFNKFGKQVQEIKINVQHNFKKLREKYKGYIIAGYGSPAKATTTLNYFGIDNTMMDYIIEDNELKVGKFVPGVNIPIVSPYIADADKVPKIIIVLAWNFFESIKQRCQNLYGNSIMVISIKDWEKENFEI